MVNSYRLRNQICDFSGQILPVVVIDHQGLHVPMPGNPLNTADVAAGEVEGFCNGCVPESMRSHCQTGFASQVSHDAIYSRSRQPTAFTSTVEVDE